jgi:hypothetical protein
METLMLIGLTGLTGYYLQDKTGRTKEGVRNVIETDSIMLENEKPNSLNIYNSNKVDAANNELLKMSLNNYKDAENPALTGILPPIYNSYSSIGNETILNKNMNEPKLSDINNINRRTNVLATPIPDMSDRPMFKSPTLGTPSNDNFSNFGSGVFTHQEVSLLSGTVLDREHNNMVPFFGSNARQNLETFTNEAKLDNYTGLTSTFIHKTEPLPLFNLVEQNIYGAPLLTDHVDTSRYIPSAYRQNEKPFYEEKVAAPIAGTLNNPISNVRQPTIDSLRTINNQQVTYEARKNTGQMGSVRGIEGSVMKNKPETSFELGHSRLFTNKGAVTGNKSTNNYENMALTSRQDQNLEYYGVAISKESLSSGPRLKSIDNTNELDFASIFQNPRNNQLRSDTQRNLGTTTTSVNDYGKDSINLPELERDTTNDPHSLNVNPNSKGHTVILQDEVKGTIKETLLGKHDNSGNIRTNLRGDSGMTDYTFKTTNKEMLIDNNYNGHINKKDGMGYNVVNVSAKTTNKELTSDFEYSGHANDINKNQMVYSTYDNPEKVRNAIHTEGYKGPANTNTSAAENRLQYQNAEISDTKEKLLKTQPGSRNSSLGVITNNNLGKQKLTANMLLKEREKTRVENVNLKSVIPSKNILGQQKDVFNNFSEIENSRINSNDISKQLSNNPFFNLK